MNGKGMEVITRRRDAGAPRVHGGRAVQKETGDYRVTWIFSADWMDKFKYERDR